MLPRYIPAVDLSARFASLTRVDSAAATRRVLTDLSLEGWLQIIPVARARYGLAAYFRDLARRDERRAVLLSAQICPVVPQVLLRQGFHPLFVDIDEGAPMPGEVQMMSALNDADHAGTIAAAIISPIYGYLPVDLDKTTDVLDGIAVLLDLAQGTLLGPSLPRLMARADAAIFSFGPGKGLDTGGGLLAIRDAELELQRNSHVIPLLTFSGLPAALAVRAAVALGLYRHLIRLIDDRVEADRSAAIDESSAVAMLPTGVFKTFASRLLKFATEIEVARKRAAIIYQRPAIAQNCRNGEIFGGLAQMHLRQIIRVRDPGRRDPVLARLREANIDAMPAGEPLPETYLPARVISTARSSGGLPNARRFRADAIRLPFLGRMDEASFEYLVATLERVLG